MNKAHSIKISALCMAALLSQPSLAAGGGNGSRSSSSSSRSAATAAAKPSPSPSPAKAVPSPAARPIGSASLKANATVQQSTTYKSINSNVTAAVPKPGQTGPTVAWGSPSKTSSVAQGLPPPGNPANKAAQGQALIRTSPPILTKAGIGISAAALGPQAQQFRRDFQDVQVVSKPTTSAWTWIFLAWALHNGSQNSNLERENASLREQMSTLERELKQHPDQWAQAQEIARSKGVSMPQEAASQPTSGAEPAQQLRDAVQPLPALVSLPHSDEDASEPVIRTLVGLGAPLMVLGFAGLAFLRMRNV